MEKLTVISGPRDSGKTLKAKEIALDFHKDEVVWIQPINILRDQMPNINGFYFNMCNKNTKLIIFDDVQNAETLNFYIALSKYSSLTVHKQMFHPFEITPRFIIVCDSNVQKSQADIILERVHVTKKHITFY
jgi:hypothetical protein